jgi:hypothetical protein
MTMHHGLIRLVLGLGLLSATGALAQNVPPPPGSLQGQSAAPPAIERLGDKLYKIGSIRVDTAKKEISVPGKVNADVMVLEFIANTRSGMRAYESAVTLDSDAVTFNTALVLIGLDPTHARGIPTAHFDPATPEGDAVDIWLDCPGKECQRFPAERLMYDRETKETLSGGAWVYTGSSFYPNGVYRAEEGGVTIGFVHDPASIIEYTGQGALRRFGWIVPNPTLGVPPNTPIVLTVTALPPVKR